MSKNWYQQSVDALQLSGKGERTQRAYIRAPRMLVDFCGKPSAALPDAERDANLLQAKPLRIGADSAPASRAEVTSRVAVTG